MSQKEDALSNAWKLQNDAASPIVTLWFDRPGASQNSLDEDCLQELAERIDEIPATAKIVAVRSSKPKGFCAGADVKRIAAFRTTDEMTAFLHLGRAAFEKLRTVPAVAIIHGVCLGGGLELALACRARIALDSEPRATFGAPEVKLGLIPGWNAVGLLPALIGWNDALALLLGGRSIDANEAKRIGLISDVIASNETSLTQWLTNFDSTNQISPKPPMKPIDLADFQKIRDSIADDPAKSAIFEVLETLNEQGIEASWDRAIEKLASLIFSDRAKEALARFSAGPSARSV